MTDEERERLEEWESLSYTDQLHYSPEHLPSDEEGA